MITHQAKDFYDVFISYSQIDKEWVLNWLLPRLEAAKLRICIDFRDFDIGIPRLVNIERAVENSRYTLFVLTPAWVNSEWAQFEALLTQTTDPANYRRRMLPLLLSACLPPPRMAMLTFADFTRPEEQEIQWTKLLAALRGKLRLAALGPLLGRLQQSNETPFYVPFLQNKNFQGREDTLETLHVALMDRVPVGIRPTGLTGMGGIGKTAMAVEYCYRYRGAYPGGIFWINAGEDWIAGVQGFAALGRRLEPDAAERSLEVQMYSLVRHLRNRPDSLLVLDNLADSTLLYQTLTPDLILISLPCHILFTTRNRDLRDFTPVEVAVLPPGPALDLLLSHLNQWNIRTIAHPERAVAKEICAILGYLPLALEIAAKHLGLHPHQPVIAYRDILLDRGALAVVDDPRGGIKPADLGTRHIAALEATLVEQYSLLKNNDAKLLLRIAGQLPETSQIPLARLGLLAGVSDTDNEFFDSALTLALKELSNFSLVEQLTEAQVRLHPLVGAFAKKLTPKAEVDTVWLHCAYNLLQSLYDVATLEHHCVKRGVLEVEQDIEFVCVLVSSLIKVKPSGLEKLHLLLRILRLTADKLQKWRPGLQPIYFTQQLYITAKRLQASELAENCLKYLNNCSHPFLLPRWEKIAVPAALVRTLPTYNFSATLWKLAMSSDALLAAVCLEDWSGERNKSLIPILILDLQTGAIRHELRGHEDRVDAITFTTTGKFVVSGSDDRTVRVWGVDNGKLLWTLTGHEHSISAVAVTDDERYAVSASKGHLFVWDMKLGRIYKNISIGNDESISSIALTPNGQRIVLASNRRTIGIWNLETGHLEATIVRKDVQSVTALADGNKIAFGSEFGHVGTLDLETGQITELPHPGFWSWAVSVDGRKALTCTDSSTLCVYDLQTGATQYMNYHEQSIFDVAITPDGRFAISGSSERICVWDLNVIASGKTALGHQWVVESIAIAENHPSCVSSSADGTIRTWNLITGAVERKFNRKNGIWNFMHGKMLTSVAISPDGQKVAGILDTSKEIVQIWKTQSKRSVGRLRKLPSMQTSPAFVSIVAFDKESKRCILGCSDGGIRVWDFATSIVRNLLFPKVVHISKDQESTTVFKFSSIHKHLLDPQDSPWYHRRDFGYSTFEPIEALALAPNGEQVVSISKKALRCWDLSNEECMSTILGYPTAQAVAFISPQRVISVSRGGRVFAYDLGIHSILKYCKLNHFTGLASAVTVTPNGKWAVTGFSNGAVNLWDLESCDELATVVIDGSVTAVAVTPNGKSILIGDAAGNLYCLDSYG